MIEPFSSVEPLKFGPKAFPLAEPVTRRVGGFRLYTSATDHLSSNEKLLLIKCQEKENLQKPNLDIKPAQPVPDSSFPSAVFTKFSER